jgi:arylsulfatase A-like enzyme
VRPAAGRRWALRAVALVAAGSLSLGVAQVPPVSGGTPDPGRPNILVILTDDQRAAGTVIPSFMPATIRWFRNRGVRYPNAFATTPLCCPSRATIFTGQYAHNHGVRLNDDTPKLDHDDTVQAYLRDAGYRTGIVGKFLNVWPIKEAPPHFDRYALVDPPAYWNVPANEDGERFRVSDYTTDYIADRAAEMIRQFGQQGGNAPWLLYVHPTAPHAPFQPEPPYRNVPVGQWPGNPAVLEKNLSDKPPYVRQTSSVDLAEGRRIRRLQLQMLMSVDDLVQEVFDALADAGEVQDTLVFFLSDNGFMWGEHRQGAKTHAYTQSVAIPFYVSWPGHLSPGTVDSRLVANVDVAPTIFDAAGVAPGHEVDGRSLLDPFARSHLFLESFYTPLTKGIPPWAGYRSLTEQYVEYYDSDLENRVFREYYDRQADPWELRNLLRDGNPGNDPPTLHTLEDQVSQDRGCHGTSGAAACP